MPLAGACWARTDADEGWYLYLVSPVADEQGVGPGYGKVRSTIGQLDREGWDEFERVDPLDVKIVGPSDRVAKALAVQYRLYPGSGSVRHDGSTLWGVPIDGAYIYPATMFAAPTAPPA